MCSLSVVTISTSMPSHTGHIAFSGVVLTWLQLGAIVGEKEAGLVTSLRHMGLLQSSYWLSWVMFDLMMGLVTALSIVMWGK